MLCLETSFWSFVWFSITCGSVLMSLPHFKGKRWLQPCMLGLKFCSFISFSLSPMINSVKQNIESRLKTRHPKLVEWFRMVELPRIAGFFIPLLKKWSMEYAGRLAHRILKSWTNSHCSHRFIFSSSTLNWKNSIKHNNFQWCCRDYSGYKLLCGSRKIGFWPYFLPLVYTVYWGRINRAHELVTQSCFSG